MAWLQLAGGFALLFFAGEALVRGAVGVSLRLGVSMFLVGLTVVGFGTSAPEFLVSLQAALAGLPALALGNAVGSNTVNVLLVLGVPALLAPILPHDRELRANCLSMSATSVVFAALCWFFGALTALSGLFLLALLALSLCLSARRARAGGRAQALPEELLKAPKGLGLCLAFLGAGIVGLPIGAHFLIEGARAIALAAGISEAAIALTLLAFGTSLPELVTGLFAAIHKRPEILLGNVIGSNMFNLMGVMGAVSLVETVPVAARFLWADIPFMLLGTFALTLFVLNGRPIGRLAGAGFTAGWLLYVRWTLLA